MTSFFKSHSSFWSLAPPDLVNTMLKQLRELSPHLSPSFRPLVIACFSARENSSSLSLLTSSFPSQTSAQEELLWPQPVVLYKSSFDLHPGICEWSRWSPQFSEISSLKLLSPNWLCLWTLRIGLKSYWFLIINSPVVLYFHLTSLTKFYIPWSKWVDLLNT